MRAALVRTLTIVAITIVGLALLGSRSATAGLIAYTMVLGETQAVVENPDNANILHMAGWQSAHDLMVQRSMPYFYVTNASATASISQFDMTIGNAADNFDWAQIVKTSPGITVHVDAPDTAMGGVTSDHLTLSFTGFGPGKFVEFKAGIEPDNTALMQNIDYRHTFFNNGSNGLGNSAVSVTFTDPPLLPGHLTSLLPDYALPGNTTTGANFTPGYGMDMVIPFKSANAGTQTVPEPGSVVLMGCGLGGLALAAWKRRRTLG